MIKHRWLYLLTFLLLAFSASSYAALDLILTKGVSGAIPIAIVPFEGASNAPQDVSTIIQSDLTNSGRFEALESNDMDEYPTTPEAVDLKAWRKKDVNAVVVGSVKALSGDRYQVKFALVSVYQGGEGKATPSDVILNQQFTVKAADLRRVSHQISDLIYQQLIGDRGVFSTKIAYILVQKNLSPVKYNLVVADQDGYNPKLLLTSSEPIMSPAWSPNGTQIAYVSFEKGRAQIYLQNIATGQRRLLSSYPGINGAPAFSPDGKQLALTLTLSGNPNIYVMNVASGQIKQMTNGSAIDTEPAFSPDGNTLIFTSNRAGGPQIYSLDLASKATQRITYDGKYNASAGFTPDGKSIIILHQNQGNYTVAKQDLSTGVVTILDNGDDQSPSLSPNGGMIVFATLYNGQEDLGMVSVDGKVKLRIPSGDGDVQEPAWSPYLN